MVFSVQGHEQLMAGSDFQGKIKKIDPPGKANKKYHFSPVNQKKRHGISPFDGMAKSGDWIGSQKKSVPQKKLPQIGE